MVDTGRGETRQIIGPSRYEGFYHSFVKFQPNPQLIDRILEQLSAWLRKKGWDPKLEESGFQSRTNSELVVVHHHTRSGRHLRFRLLEQSSIGEWHTELTVSAPPIGNAWMSLDVTNSERRFVKVPRLADRILDVLNGFDGPAMLTSTPVVVPSEGVDDLVDELTSPDREGIFFVAGTGTETTLFAPFQDKVARWTGQVRGLARVVVLDPNATTELTARLGGTHAVTPWTIRTFLPLVDPSKSIDSRRHRVLGARALGELPDDEIKRIITKTARTHGATRALPTGAVQVMRALTRIESKNAVQELERPTAPTEGPTPPTTDHQIQRPTSDDNTTVFEQVAAYRAQIDLVRQILDVDDLDVGTLRDLADRARHGAGMEAATVRIKRQLDDRQTRVEELEDDVAHYQRYLDDETIEHAAAEEDRRHKDDEIRWLRNQLALAQNFDAAYGKAPDSAYTDFPQNFEILISRASKLEDKGVILTADHRKIIALDEHDTLGNLSNTAWEALLTLCDYLRARKENKHTGGLDQYLKNTPSGYRTLSNKKFATTETARTMDAWGDERLFPVPKDVDPNGRAIMKTHFKLGRVGMVSPRMYLLDRSAVNGKVYVGYLGAHLTNSQTN